MDAWVWLILSVELLPYFFLSIIFTQIKEEIKTDPKFGTNLGVFGTFYQFLKINISLFLLVVYRLYS